MAEKSIEVVVGTNEEYVLGYQLCTGEDGKSSFEQSFADHSHTGSVRQVAIGGKYLVSGGTDEHIKMFDLEKHTEIGALLEHEGTITFLGFVGDKYLFSASEDGNICIFGRTAKTGWQRDKTLAGHKSSIVSMSIHPSGKLALSLSRDQKLRTWNLIKGRKAYISHMDKISDLVQWSPAGKTYAIVKGTSIEVYDVATCKVIHTVDFRVKVTTLVFLTEDIVAVAAGDKNICFYDITNHFEILQWEAHQMRVKCLSIIPNDDEDEPWLVSASSDGVIRLWKLQMLDLTSQPKLLAEVETTCRIICMAVYVSSKQKKTDRIKKIVEEEKSKSKKGVKASVTDKTEKKKIMKKRRMDESTEDGIVRKKKAKKNKISDDHTRICKEEVDKSTKEEDAETGIEQPIENAESTGKKKMTKKKEKVTEENSICKEEMDKSTEENSAETSIEQPIENAENGTGKKKMIKKNKMKMIKKEKATLEENKENSSASQKAKKNIPVKVNTEAITETKKAKKLKKKVNKTKKNTVRSTEEDSSSTLQANVKNSSKDSTKIKKKKKLENIGDAPKKRKVQ